MLLTPNGFYRLIFCAALFPLAGCGGSDDDAPATTALACTDFKAGQTIGDGVIVSATAVAASGPLPEFCDVRGTLAPKTAFAIRMPTQWNSRTVFVGGGGFNGNLAAPNAQYLSSGFAQMASTGGNDVPNTANFALDPLALNDYSSSPSIEPIKSARRSCGRITERTRPRITSTAAPKAGKRR